MPAIVFDTERPSRQVRKDSVAAFRVDAGDLDGLYFVKGHWQQFLDRDRREVVAIDSQPMGDERDRKANRRRPWIPCRKMQATEDPKRPWPADVAQGEQDGHLYAGFGGGGDVVEQHQLRLTRRDAA